jgi:hypothetical protein
MCHLVTFVQKEVNISPNSIKKKKKALGYMMEISTASIYVQCSRLKKEKNQFY